MEDGGGSGSQRRNQTGATTTPGSGGDKLAGPWSKDKKDPSAPAADKEEELVRARSGRAESRPGRSQSRGRASVAAAAGLPSLTRPGPGGGSVRRRQWQQNGPSPVGASSRLRPSDASL